MSDALNRPLEVLPDARLEKRTRRRFSSAQKQRLLAEFAQVGHGEKGAWKGLRVRCASRQLFCVKI